MCWPWTTCLPPMGELRTWAPARSWLAWPHRIANITNSALPEQSLMSSHAVSTIEGVTLSPQQSRLWRFQEEQKRGKLRTRFTITIHGQVDQFGLEGAWLDVQERHQILRTVLEYLPGIKEPIQVVREQGSSIGRCELPVGADPFGTKLFARMESRDAKDEGLNGETVVALYTVNAERHVLAFSLSALLADGESARIIFQDLCAAYGAAGASGARENIPYAQFSRWCAQQRAGGEGVG